MIWETRIRSDMALHAAWSPPVGIRFLALARGDCQRPVRYSDRRRGSQICRWRRIRQMRGSPRNSD